MELKETSETFNVSLKTGEKKCKGRKVTSTIGIARITGIHDTTCSSERLKKNMGGAVPALPGLKKGEKAASRCQLESCSAREYPSEAHHLIPHDYLPTQSVCNWLVKPDGKGKAPYTRDKEYALAEDTNYDTDHPRNGLCLPHAADTREWIQARDNSRKKAKIAFRLMNLTNKQLHQGKHTHTVYVPNTAGYKTEVGRLLNLVSHTAKTHAKICAICKEKGKKKLRPRNEVVEHMHGVSDIMRASIAKNKVFVSRRAAEYYIEKKAGNKPGSTPYQ